MVMGDDDEFLSEAWNEKTNAYNNIINFLESIGVEEKDIVRAAELMKEYEQSLIKWHSFDRG